MKSDVSQSDRREELQEWFRFICADSHILKKHPEFIWQQGANQPENGYVSRRALALEKSGRWIERPWLKWINKPAQPSTCIRTLTGHTSVVYAVAVMPDGRRAVSASYDKTLKLWDIESGEELRTMVGHSESIRAVAAVPDRDLIVSGSDDMTVRVWSAESGRALRTFKGHKYDVNAVAVFPDGRRIASASGDGSVKIWEVEGNKELFTLSGHTGPVRAVAISPNGERIISGGNDNTVRFWDAETGRLLKIIDRRAFVTFDTPTGEGWVSRLVLSRDGSLILTSGAGSINFWDLETGRLLRAFNDQTVESLALTPDGQRIVSAHDDKTVRIRDAESGELLEVLSGHGWDVTGVAVTPDGSRAVTSSADQTVKVWSIKSSPHVGQSRRAPVRQHEIEIKGIAMAGDSCLVSIDAWTLNVWDIRDEEPCFSLKVSGLPRELTTLEQIASLIGARRGEPPNHVANCMAVTPDGRRIVSGGDWSVRIWDAGSGRQIRILEDSADIVQAVAVTADGSRIVSGSYHGLRVWDIERGQELMSSGDSQISALALSPDGRYIVSGSEDGAIKIRDADSLREIRALHAHDGSIESLSVTQDSRRLISTGWDRTLKVWEIDTGEMTACFFCDSNIMATSSKEMRIFAGDYVGNLYALELCGVKAGPRVVAPYLKRGGHRCRCSHCLKEIKISVSDFGNEIDCAHCQKRLRVNGFVVIKRGIS